MVKVELPRASWDQVTYILSRHNENALVLHLWNEIQDQLDSQEY